MLRTDAEALVRLIGQLWPNWQATDALTNWWIDALAELPDESDARKALVQLKKASRFNTPPNFSAIADEIGVHKPRPDWRGQRDREADTHWFVQCVRAPEKFPGRLGWYLPLLWQADHEPPVYAQAQAAQTYAERCRQTYGGDWRVIQDATYSDMIVASRDLRQGQPKATRVTAADVARAMCGEDPTHTMATALPSSPAGNAKPRQAISGPSGAGASVLGQPGEPQPVGCISAARGAGGPGSACRS